MKGRRHLASSQPRMGLNVNRPVRSAGYETTPASNQPRMGLNVNSPVRSSGCEWRQPQNNPGGVEPFQGSWFFTHHLIHGFAPMAIDVEPRSGFLYRSYLFFSHRVVPGVIIVELLRSFSSRCSWDNRIGPTPTEIEC